ncbi:MAG: cytochrome peroxidase [bacterium]|nr:cytochrome peroxidase [bacterium]
MLTPPRPQDAPIVASLLFAARVAVAAPAAAPTQPPIPPLDALAAPRPLHQTGLPVQQALATVPADNPQTPEKIALGEKLFFDGRLSADGTAACASCHAPDRAFTDGKAASVGIHGRLGQRNAPTVLNALFNKTQFWDGRAKTLEDQVALPIVNPTEMGQPSMDAAVRAIAAIPEYRTRFSQVFGRAPNALDLQRAIASYERTLLSFDSPFDRFIAGDRGAISDAARRGWELFNGRALCNRCHAVSEKQPNLVSFTDDDFHNIGIGILRHNVVPLAQKADKLVSSGDAAAIDRAAIESDLTALGRFLITRKRADIASFKTPNLRNVVMTGPYFHDGSQETLWDIVDHYNKGDGLKDPFLDEDIQPLALSESDIDDMVAFLASLTSAAYAKPAADELERQRAIARVRRPQRDTARAFGPKPPRPKPPEATR